MEALDDGLLDMQSPEGDMDSPPLSSERRRQLARHEVYPHAALARIRTASGDLGEQSASLQQRQDPSSGSASQQIISILRSQTRENTRYAAYDAARSHSQISRNAASSLSHLHV
jgi:hypothetical protein